MDVVLESSDFVLSGLLITLRIALLSFVFAFVIGIMISAFRVSPIGPLQGVGSAYVSLFRNAPLVALFFLFFFGLPKLGLLFSPIVSATIVLSGYTGAYLGEVIRSGINSVSKGQAEAARAIGLHFGQVLSLIILPQALRTVVGPIGNLFIANLKNSSIAFTIGVLELTGTSFRVANRTARPVEALGTAAVVYVVLVLVAGFVFGRIERRVAIRR